jgi:hypothetical protein
VHGPQRSYTAVRSTLLSIHAENCVGGVVGRAAVDIQDYHPVANEVLLVTVFDGLNGLRDRSRIVVRGNSHQQIDFADAHQLAKKIVSEKDVFRQVKVRS